MSDELPHATWSGVIGGIRVHVLSDGRRIIDADDFHRLLNGEIPEADLGNPELTAFIRGEGSPAQSAATEKG
jgi:hypothetical protein